MAQVQANGGNPSALPQMQMPGFPMMQQPMMPGMFPGAAHPNGADSSAQQHYMPMPGMMPMMYPPQMMGG